MFIAEPCFNKYFEYYDIKTISAIALSPEKLNIHANFSFLLPFNRCRGFAGDVIYNSVYLRYFIANSS